MIYPENATILAPLSGFTDLPYRRAARRCSCRYAFTEMVDAASIAYSPERAKTLLTRGEDEEFLGVQLVGADLDLLQKATIFLNDFDFSLLDLNLGCPVPKVVRKGAGAALGADHDRAARAVDVLVKYSRFPVTAKIRIQDEVDPEKTLDLAKKLVDAGIEALTIHGRSRAAFYSGIVHGEIIKFVAENLPVPVIANGGVNSPESAAALRKESSCSRLMLAQGAMGNPWLFRLLDNGEHPSMAEWQSMVMTHVSEMAQLYGEESGLVMARKICHDYLKGRGFPAAARAEASKLTTLAQLEALLSSLSAPPESSGSAGRKIRSSEPGTVRIVRR